MAGLQAHPGEDPAVGGHPGATGGVDRAQDQRRRLVDRPLRGVPLVVRERQRPVVRRRGAEPRRRPHDPPKAASGLVADTSLIRAHRLSISTRCSAGVRPSAARRALSIIAYCWTGSHRRWATSTGSSSGPPRVRRTSGTTPGWGVSTGGRPAFSSSRAHRLASPPTTTATSDAPDRMAASASSMRPCWGMPEFDEVGGGARRPDPGRHDPGRIRVGPAPLGDGYPVDGRGQPPAAGVGQRRLRRLHHQLHGLGRSEAVPTPTRTGVRGSRDPFTGSGPPGSAHRAPGLAAGGADRRSRSIRPSVRHVTSTAPRERASARARSGRS